MFNPEQQRMAKGPPLRVALALTSSLITVTVAARENVRFSTEGLPGRSGNSTIRWGDSPTSGPEREVAEEPALRLSENNPPLLEPKKVVPASLATFERVVLARIYFENPYFPLLRQPPSRVQ
jgi:hypothetical protein